MNLSKIAANITSKDDMNTLEVRNEREFNLNLEGALRRGWKIWQQEPGMVIINKGKHLVKITINKFAY